jgi:hypothetical protein
MQRYKIFFIAVNACWLYLKEYINDARSNERQKEQEIHIKVASIAAEVRIWYISNATVQTYRYSRLLHHSMLNARVLNPQSVMCNKASLVTWLKADRYSSERSVLTPPHANGRRRNLPVGRYHEVNGHLARCVPSLYFPYFIRVREGAVGNNADLQYVALPLIFLQPPLYTRSCGCVPRRKKFFTFKILVVSPHTRRKVLLRLCLSSIHTPPSFFLDFIPFASLSSYLSFPLNITA